MSALRAWLRSCVAGAHETAVADLKGMCMLWSANPGGWARLGALVREPNADVHIHGRDCDVDWQGAVWRGLPVPTCGADGRYPWPDVIAGEVFEMPFIIHLLHYDMVNTQALLRQWEAAYEWAMGSASLPASPERT